MRFAAFISYSHSGDSRVAAAIQSGLQRLAKPWHKRRALNVFRDQTNLGASPGLWLSIESALQESEWFVLMASPEAAGVGLGAPRDRMVADASFDRAIHHRRHRR